MCGRVPGCHYTRICYKLHSNVSITANPAWTKPACFLLASVILSIFHIPEVITGKAKISANDWREV